MQIGCLQVHREHPGKDPTQFLGKEPQLSWEHQALQGHGWHLHMWVIILRERHQVQQLLSQVSQPAHHSQPTFAASLPSGCPRIFGISRRSPAASLSQCPQIFCPSCLLVLKLTPAHPLRPSSRVTSSMKRSVIFRRQMGPLLLCLPSLCCRAGGLSRWAGARYLSFTRLLLYW